MHERNNLLKKGLHPINPHKVDILKEGVEKLLKS